jgi:NAD(P)-dependent dehydrogenase (short-subunit alcohol dehydrogenase family)
LKTIVVTGGGRGLGRVTAGKLARLGHHVILTVRRPADGESAVAEIRRSWPDARVEARELDLASFASIRTFARTLVEAGRTIDVLLHNAGIMQQSPTRLVSADNLEQTLAVNAIAPYLLTHELWPTLLRSSAARVVCVSSRLHLPGSRGAPVNFDFADPQLERGYQHDRAYKNSKLAILWFCYELARRSVELGVTANGVCPGFVPLTAAESTHGLFRWMMRHVMVHMPFATSVDAATDSLVFMCTDPSLDRVTGALYAERQPIASSPDSHDVALARRFWDYAAQLTGIDPNWPRREPQRPQ